MYFAYLLRCADGTLYAGITTDPARRLREHKVGVGARYTRARGAATMAHVEEFPDRSSASKREAALKKLSRPQKLALIRRGRP